MTVFRTVVWSSGVEFLICFSFCFRHLEFTRPSVWHRLSLLSLFLSWLWVVFVFSVDVRRMHTKRQSLIKNLFWYCLCQELLLISVCKVNPTFGILLSSTDMIRVTSIANQCILPCLPKLKIAFNRVQIAHGESPVYLSIYRVVIKSSWWSCTVVSTLKVEAWFWTRFSLMCRFCIC